MRDINIAISYHNTGKTLQEVGLEYGVSSSRVRDIHFMAASHVLRCLDKYLGYHQLEKRNHCDETAKHLQEYKDFLQGDEVRIEVILNDIEECQALVLGKINNAETIVLRICKDIKEVEIKIDDLKAALRTLSVK